MADPDLSHALDRAQRRLRSAGPPAGSDATEALVARFLAGYREPTRSAYAGDLRAYRAFLSSRGADLLSAGPGDVRAHVVALEQRGAAPATIRRRLAAVSGVHRCAVDAGLTRLDPAARHPRPVAPVPRPAAPLPAPDAVGRLLAAARRRGPRDTALVALLALAGLRLGEALRVARSDIEDLGGQLVLTIGGPGHRRRTIRLSARAAHACRPLLDGPGSAPLLATRSGGHLDRHAARVVIRRLGLEAGLGPRLTPRGLRQACAAEALRVECDIAAVGARLGWADLRPITRHRPVEAGASVGAAAVSPSISG